MANHPRRHGLRVVLLTYIVAIAVFILVYHATDIDSALRRALVADIVATLVVFIGSILLNNSSVYDPYWSVFPPIIYVAWALEGGSVHTVAVLVIVLGLLWAVRLTWNWASGWGGSTHEDWRYVEFREQFGRLHWLVSLTAIHLFPTIVVFLASVPVYFVVTGGISSIPLATVAAVVTLSAILIEATADKQLRRFKRSGGTGPCVIGLWRFSRHPNYLGELGFWLGLMIFGLAAGAPWWSVAGMSAMLVLFVYYSIPAMERKIEAARPSYSRIREHVPILLPVPGRYLPQEEERTV